MNKLVASLAGFALATGSAFAADMPLKAAAPSPPASSWTGCYVDAGAGYGMWTQDHFTETLPGLAGLAPLTTTGGRGWLGRFGGGCDYQLGQVLNGNLVVGVLADYDFASINGNFQDSFTGVAGSEKESGSWAIGGRLGYAVTPAFLTYVDGGYTQARFDQVGFSPAGLDIGQHDYNGWFLGGGTETALGGLLPFLPSGLFLRTEYRYATYEAADLPIEFAGIPTGFGEHMTNHEQTITTSLVWKFNWPALVPAQ